ncbi:MAG: flagellar biosynthesis protein FlhB [Candidatus Margulisiibacteriota bacterium]|jgi:flagellar biosynthetic protein FlhB
MADDDSGDKTEEPTPHKLAESRKKGQIAKSKEITSALLYIASYMALRSFGEQIWFNLVHFSNFIFRQIPNVDNIQGLAVQEIFLQALIVFLVSVGPLFGVVFILAILIEFFQTGGLVAGEALTPKLEKINPMEGFKRMFGMKGFVMLIINLVKIGIVVWITGSVLIDLYPVIITTMNNNLWLTMMFTGDSIYKIAMRISMFYVFVAAFDFFYQRFEFLKGMKMSKKEIKEEYKRLEGDPQVKRRMRQMQQDMSRSRMMGNVPKSDVVVTNPTHYAVAIKYDTKNMRAPVVLAKGQLLHAQKIREIAEANYIPIVENASLARGLFKVTEVGQEIPYELYKAVAEVLAFVYNLKKKQRGK